MSKLLNFIKRNTLLVVLGVVILLLGVFVIKTVFFGGGSDFYTPTENIFKNELGTFKYVLDVRTGAKGTVIKEVSSSDTSVDDLNNLAADDTEAQNAETEVDDYIDDMQPDQIDDADSSKNLVNWADSANVKTGNWKYPNYKITIEGCTTSLEPLTTKFDISIATEYWNDKFTEVICFKIITILILNLCESGL